MGSLRSREAKSEESDKREGQKTEAGEVVAEPLVPEWWTQLLNQKRRRASSCRRWRGAEISRKSALRGDVDDGKGKGKSEGTEGGELSADLSGRRKRGRGLQAPQAINER